MQVTWRGWLAFCVGVALMFLWGIASASTGAPAPMHNAFSLFAWWLPYELVVLAVFLLCFDLVLRYLAAGATAAALAVDWARRQWSR